MVYIYYIVICIYNLPIHRIFLPDSKNIHLVLQCEITIKITALYKYYTLQVVLLK